jgi:hypothetical protein
LLARLAEMEADIAALKGGPYSNATFKGTYRCQVIEIDAHGSDAQGYAGVELGSAGADSAVADGAGSVTLDGIWTTWGLTWWVSGTKLGVGTDGPWDEDDGPAVYSYTVSADGGIDLAGVPGLDAWISRNGDTVVILTRGINEDGDYNVAQNICVRTVGP